MLQGKKKNPGNFKKGMIPWNKGKPGYKFRVKRKTTEQTRKILSEAKKRNPVKFWYGKKFLQVKKLEIRWSTGFGVGLFL